MIIKSNTLGKLQKIKNGNVFDNPLIFIRELLQNSQRSKSSNVYFEVMDGVFRCIDDGCGCSNPDNVFTLDLSSWDSTNEGYGIGFWSCLCVPDITSITVKSKNWKCSIDTVRLFKDGDLTVDKINISPIDGFEVIIESPFFDDIDNSKYEEIESMIHETSVFLPFNTYLNELKMSKKDIFDTFVSFNLCKIYDNRIFKAKLGVSTGIYPDIKIYYDSRFVCEMSLFDYVEGVIEIKPNKITLREPDRTRWTRDDKYYSFIDKLRNCIEDLFLSHVKENGIDNDDFCEGINNYLDVKDYEKYLVFDDTMVELKDAKKKNNHEIAVVEEDTEDVPIDNSCFKKSDVSVVQHLSVAKVCVQNNPVKDIFKDKIKKLKKSVWVKKREYSSYEKFISKAKYKGLNVIIAKNALYEAALEKYNITHISKLEDCFVETFHKKNISLKTLKEETFIELLKPICKEFNIPLTTFLIANLSLEDSFVVDGNVLIKNVISNSKNNIQIYGVTDGVNIYLDRTALSLNKFNIKKGNIGIWELKALMNSINTIAHELSHFLYNTTDNTTEQYNHEITIQQKIINLYV